jgi:YgiT-type zinc finger domain-containing protein
VTGELANDRCYFCGGRLETKSATIPFVVDESIIIIKSVPAEVCTQCAEPILSSPIARKVDSLLKQVYRLHSEISVVGYAEPMLQSV